MARRTQHMLPRAVASRAKARRPKFDKRLAVGGSVAFTALTAKFLSEQFGLRRSQALRVEKLAKKNKAQAKTLAKNITTAAEQGNTTAANILLKVEKGNLKGITPAERNLITERAIHAGFKEGAFDRWRKNLTTADKQVFGAVVGAVLLYGLYRYARFKIRRDIKRKGPLGPRVKARAKKGTKRAVKNVMFPKRRAEK